MENYILKMKSPKEMRIICIDITNKCDLACSNCTRLLANQEFLWDMTIENFRKAVASLKNFPGIVILIGGILACTQSLIKFVKFFLRKDLI